jgi:hypothetical protein
MTRNGFSAACLMTTFLGIFVISCDSSRSVDPADKDYFIKYYGGNGNQTGVDMISKDDGTYLLLGNWENALSEKRIYLVNVDERGRVIKETKLGTTNEDARDIERTVDGNFIILSEDNSGSNSQFKLIRVTGDGAKIDSVIYGSAGHDHPKTVTALYDGGFIIAGVTEYTEAVINPSAPDDLSDIFFARCDANYNFEINWDEQYSQGPVEGAVKVIENSPTHFYVFGFSDQDHAGNSSGNVNLFYFEIGATGVAGAYNFLGDYDNDTEAAYVLRAPVALGGEFFVAATEITASGSVDLHVSKLRKNLTFQPADDEIFDRSIPIGSRKLTALAAAQCFTGEKGYLLVANETQEDGTSNIWLTKIHNTTGSVLWSTTFGSEEEDDLGGAVMELADGKILLLGTIGLVNNQSKMVLMKLNSTGQLME